MAIEYIKDAPPQNGQPEENDKPKPAVDLSIRARVPRQPLLKHVVPHASTFQGLVSNLAKAYRNADEAFKDSRANARFMLNDLVIRECLDARQRATALLNWHLEPEDENSPLQKGIVAKLTAILRRTPRFTEYRRCLLDAIWFGKAAVSQTYVNDFVGGELCCRLDKWRPVNGDKIYFRQDADGVRADQPGVLLNPHNPFVTTDKADRVELVDIGHCYFLDDWEERFLFPIHRHFVYDAAWETPLDAGSINGVGLRSVIYWTWFQKQEILALMVELLERTAQTLRIYWYPAGNPAAKAEVEEIAKGESTQDNRIVMPRESGDDENSGYGISVVEGSPQGIETLKTVLHDYYGHLIKRYILGQVLTSEAEATGLGSGVAEIHLDSFMQIVKYDASNLDETMTYGPVRALKDLNFPGAENIHIRFVSEVESPDVEKKLEALGKAYDMGLKIPARSVADLVGVAMATEDEETLERQSGSENPMMPGGIPGQAGMDDEDAPRRIESEFPPQQFSRSRSVYGMQFDESKHPLRT